MDITTIPYHIKKIISLITAPAKGVKPTFEEYHVIKALLVLYEKEPIGRQLLSRYLGISITATRTLIKRLKSVKLVDVDPVGGCFLTTYGHEIVKRILNVIVWLGDVTEVLDQPLLLYKKAYAFLIKRGVELFELHGITNVRDVIIRHGAVAVVIVYISNSSAYIPPYRDFDENRHPSLRRLRSHSNVEDRDAIVIVFAENKLIAEKALLHALLELNIL